MWICLNMLSSIPEMYVFTSELQLCDWFAPVTQDNYKMPQGSVTVRLTDLRTLYSELFVPILTVSNLNFKLSIR